MSTQNKIGLVSLGANTPMDEETRIAALDAALQRIGRDLAQHGTLTASAYHRTPAYPVGIGSDFVNACARFETPLGAEALLVALHRIEADAGRVRQRRWGERPLDLDLLALDDEILPDAATQAGWMDLTLAAQRAAVPDRVILPHPRLQERGFVLVPLAEIAPDWIHPVTGLSVTAMRDTLPPARLAGIERL